MRGLLETDVIINRFIFVVLLGSFALAVYLWKRFKPEGWESPEFKYHPGTGEDLPEVPLEVTLLGGSGYGWGARGGSQRTWSATKSL